MIGKKGTIFLIILAIFFILLVFGIMALTDVNKKTSEIDTIAYILFTNGNLPDEFLLHYASLYRDIFIPKSDVGYGLIGGGIIGIGISIFSYLISITEFQYSYPTKTTVSYRKKPSYRMKKFRIKTRKKLILSKCPACKAPLKKSPPCECEFCGSVIKKVDG